MLVGNIWKMSTTRYKKKNHLQFPKIAIGYAEATLGVHTLLPCVPSFPPQQQMMMGSFCLFCFLSDIWPELPSAPFPSALCSCPSRGCVFKINSTATEQENHPDFQAVLDLHKRQDNGWEGDKGRVVANYSESFAVAQRDFMILPKVHTCPQPCRV